MSSKNRNLTPQVPGQAPVQPVDQAEQLTGEQVIESAEQAAEVGQAPVQPQTKQIDPKTLKQPVLTSEGWICPEV
jgi:hypothetical protein